MGAKFTLDATSAGAVKAIELVNKAVDKTEKGLAEAAKAGKKLDDQLARDAQRVKEMLDPQEKLNRHYQKLGELVKANKLTLDQATQAGVKYRQELGLAAKETEKAHGPQAKAWMQSTLSTYVSLGAAIGIVVKGLRDEAALRESAAQKARDSRSGLGSLAQLAATSPNREETFRLLLEEARGLVASGAATDENEAGNLLFALKSAGLGSRDRAFAGRLRSSGVLQNVGGAAASYDALVTALGKGNVGSFEQFMSKALQAASVAPGSFEQLPVAVAGAGGSAKELGVSDEFLLAAGAILAKATGSPSEGGTQIAAFLKQLRKSGLNLSGKSGAEMVEAVAALPKKKQGFGGVLGDRSEAIQGFETLRDNLALLKALEGDIAGAQSLGLAGVATGLPELDPQLRAAIAAMRAQGGADVAAGAQLSEYQNMLETMRSERNARFIRNGQPVQRWLHNTYNAMSDMIPGMEYGGAWGEAALRSQKGEFSEGTQGMIEDYLRRQTQSLENIDKKNNTRATTRQE